MKRQLLILLVISLASLALNTGKSVAQSTARVQIPFDFIVNNHVLPAGSYFVTRIERHVVRLTSQSTSATAIVNPHPDEKPQSPSLVFMRVGREYFLAEVWFDRTAGLKVPQSERQKEALLAFTDVPGKRVVALR